MKHELKTWPEFFQPVKRGEKPFEIRENDRNYQVGDVLALEEFDPCRKCGATGRMWDNGDKIQCDCMTTKFPKGRFTGDVIERRVTYLTGFAQTGNRVVMGLSENAQAEAPSLSEVDPPAAG